MTGIRIRREADAYVDRRRKYRVVIDGEEVATIGRGETTNIPLEPGRHSVWLQIDWTGSETELFAGEADQTIEFVCGPRYAPIDVLLGMLRSIKDRDDWIILERT